MTKAEKDGLVKMLIKQKHENKANGIENVNLGLDQAITLISNLEVESEHKGNKEEKGE